jgi:O-antigen/teichoic acid export membrane protein
MRALAPGRLGAGVNLMLGLGVFGAAGYVFVAIIGYAFTGPESAADVGALTSFYLLMNIIGPGLFAALEPEISRAVSANAAVGRPIRPVVMRAVSLAMRIFAGFAVGVLVLWPVILSTVLGGRLSLLAGLVLGGAGAAAVFCVRGFLSGERRYGRYALTLYLEGGARLVPCVLLFLLAVREPGLYGIAFAAGSVVAAVALVPAVRLGPVVLGSNDRVVHMGRSVTFLATATLLSQLVANLAPVVVTYRMPDDLVAASAFGVTFVLARIPLMLFTPIQAILLPQLSSAAASKRLDVVRARIRQAIAVVVALGVVAVAGCAVAGPWAVRLLFNAPTVPGRLTFALLGAAAVLIMVALVLQPALVAMQHQRIVTVAWATGSVVYVAVLFAPVEPIVAALAAQLAGPAVVLAVAGGYLFRILRTGAAVTEREI